MQLISLPLSALKLLAAGDLSAAELELGLEFPAAKWPDDPEMKEGLAVHLSACEQHPRDVPWRVFVIVDEHDAAAGHAGFKGGPGRGGELEIYWCVEPRWRGKGVAKAAAASLCAHAFAQHTVTAITATISRQNVASQHVAAALGMRPVGRETKYGLPLWRIIRDEWCLRATPPNDFLPVIMGEQATRR